MINRQSRIGMGLDSKMINRQGRIGMGLGYEIMWEWVIIGFEKKKERYL